jgi:DNA helicase-2/ATP-dependent DNA helicase PcrA
MQRIYHGGTAEAIRAAEAAWSALRESGIAEELDTPHRWAADPSLGQWILAARSRLRDGGQLDLTCGLPPSVRIVRADNTAQRARGYGLSPADRRPIDQVVDAAASALVLTPQNAIVLALRAFFNRRFPIWEGHVREYLGALCDALVEHEGDARAISAAVVTFLGGVCKGFSPSAYGDRLQEEVASGCSAKRRGKPATVQALGRHLIEEPNHRGVATLLRRLIGLIETDPSFSDICLDHRREYFDAIALAEFDSPMDGLAELSHRRGARHPAPPAKSISTIHKAKGLECETVIVIPCDVVNFPDSPGARRKLYVAMSRATASLTLVVPRTNPSPLLRL